MAAFRRNLVQLDSERHSVLIGQVNKRNVGIAAVISASQHGLVLVFSTRHPVALRDGWPTVPLIGSAIVSDGMRSDMGPPRWNSPDPFRTSFANWPKRIFDQCIS